MMRKNLSSFIAASLIFILLLSSGCTNQNSQLNPTNIPLEKRKLNHTQASIGRDELPVIVSGEQPLPTTHPTREQTGPINRGTAVENIRRTSKHPGYFVGLAISGGGSRSANFSAAVLAQLDRIGFLKHVDYISSVSGGSLTAAYYCAATNEEWTPKNVQVKMTHAFATHSLLKFLLPWNLIATAVSDYDRSDLLAETFERKVFNRNGRGLTFADLRHDRPRLLINATDLQSGKKFIFCNETFDELNSDLSKYPLSWAVTASAAVPVVLHQVTLRDFSTVFEQYRHFIDGGIADNLGIQSLVETYDLHNRTAAALNQDPPYPNGAIFIIVDARTRFNADLSSRGDTDFFESMKFGSGLVSTALLSRASSASLEDLILRYSPDNTTAGELRQNIADLRSTGYLQTEDSRHRPVSIVHFALSFTSQLDQLPFQNFSQSVDSISTYFNISTQDAYHLYQAADLLMKEKYEPLLKTILNQLEKK